MCVTFAAGGTGAYWTSPSALVTVELETGEPEALMELLLGLGACATSVRANNGDGDPAATAILRATLNDKVPLWKRSLVTAMFDADSDLGMIGEAVRNAFDLPEAPVLRPQPVEDRDWVAHVQKSWDPLLLARGFEVRLPWHGGLAGGSRNEQGRVVLQLKGGAAFGLGDHPTTQGAAAFLERAVPVVAASMASGSTVDSGPRVLDYGTGSGVLAICAGLLGAKAVVGVDVDAQSIASAQRSAALTPPPAATLEFREGPTDFRAATAFASALTKEAGAFDIVVANILRGPLVELAPAFSAATRPGAILGLTGLRSELGDVEAIVAAYEHAFEDFRHVQLEGGWLLLEARRL